MLGSIKKFKREKKVCLERKNYIPPPLYQLISPLLNIKSQSINQSRMKERRKERKKQVQHLKFNDTKRCQCGICDTVIHNGMEKLIDSHSSLSLMVSLPLVHGGHFEN